MRQRQALLFDVAVAVIAAVLIVVLSPGLALVGVIALVAMILVLLSLFFGWIWGRVRPGRRDPVEQVRRLRRAEAEPTRRRSQPTGGRSQPGRERRQPAARRRPPRAGL